MLLNFKCLKDKFCIYPCRHKVFFKLFQFQRIPFFQHYVLLYNIVNKSLQQNVFDQNSKFFKYRQVWSSKPFPIYIEIKNQCFIYIIISILILLIIKIKSDRYYFILFSTMVNTQKQMNFFTTVTALVNGMIGGSILVLPLISLAAGWLQSIFVILITGIFSYYSCYLSIIHLGDQNDLDLALLRHFNGSKVLKIFYDICVWSGILLLLTLYFSLIVIQWEGLVPPYEPTYTNPIVNAVFLLLWCLCLKFFEFGAHIMGYGIVSIVGYLIFLIWVVSSAPSGNRTIPDVGTGLAGFAAMMGNAFSIQGFFIPVMKYHKNEKKHHLILLLAFIIGGLAYYYIAYMGAFGIVNRSSRNTPQTIENYFDTGQWQVKILEGIYLIHLYSVFPEYLLVSKKRFFSMFGLKQSQRRRINIPEIIYISFAVILSLIIGILNVNIDIIIEINGAVLGFCFVYFLPSILHIKCLYFPKGKRLLKQSLRQGQFINYKQGQDNNAPEIQLQEQKNYQQNLTSQKRNYQDELEVKVQIIDGKLVANGNLQTAKLTEDIDYSYFYCSYEKPQLKKQFIEMTLVTIMLLMGLFIMVNGLIDVAQLIKES